METKFNVGDVVALKSGGPKMTITQNYEYDFSKAQAADILDSPIDAMDYSRVFCTFTSLYGIFSSYFDVEVLENISENTKKYLESIKSRNDYLNGSSTNT